MRCNECLSCLSDCPVFGQKVVMTAHSLAPGLLSSIMMSAIGKTPPRLDSFLDQCILCNDVSRTAPGYSISGDHQRSKGSVQGEESLGARLADGPAVMGGSHCLLVASPLNALLRKKVVRKATGPDPEDRMRRPLSRIPQATDQAEGAGKTERKVAYFLGCFDKFNDPKTAGPASMSWRPVE